MQKIGIFGGTFNPVHSEHVLTAKKAIDGLKLDKLFIMPSHISPHKIGADVVSFCDRYNMLKLAFTGVDKVEISDYEEKKGGVSYTFETLGYFKNLYPDAELCFLMGEDMINDFPTWKNPDIIAKLATLVFVRRKDAFGGGEKTEKTVAFIKKSYGARVFELDFCGDDDSSSKIRVYNKLGLDITPFTDKSVAEYIKSKGLYAGDINYERVKKYLPKKRLIHTAGVILTATLLSKAAGADKKKAELAALYHDVAKSLDPKNYPDFVDPSDGVKSVTHQFLGAYIMEREFNITDEEIINAVKYHTTGRANMTALEKLIFTADAIEPSRTYKNADELRRLTYRDFNAGFIEVLKEIYEMLENSGNKIYYLTKVAYESYVK